MNQNSTDLFQTESQRVQYNERSVTTICKDSGIRKFGNIRMSPEQVSKLPTPTDKLIDESANLRHGLGESVSDGLLMAVRFEDADNEFGWLSGDIPSNLDLPDGDSVEIMGSEYKYATTGPEIVFLPKTNRILYYRSTDIIVEDLDTNEYTDYTESAQVYMVPDSLSFDVLPTHLQKQLTIQKI